MRWLIPGGRGHNRRLRREFAIELAHHVIPRGRVLTTGDRLGASFELPPGNWAMSVPFSGAVGLVGVFGTRMRRAMRTQTLFEREHIEEPHYYIRCLGVAPRAQGHGLGTALLRATLDQCDRDGVPAYIEASSQRSAALYRRLGFVCRGELRVPNGPPVWPMRRPPAGSGLISG